MSNDQIAVASLQTAQASADYAAYSALAAWIFGVTALLLNLIGFYVLWRQLHIAQEATIVAKSAMELTQLETRPWIKVEAGDGASVTLNVDGFYVSLTVECTNIGKTPAISLGLKTEIIPDKATDLSDRIQRLASSSELDASTIFPSDELYFRRTVVRETSNPNDAVGVNVLCVVTYRAHPKGPQFVTPMLVQESGLTWASIVPGDYDVELLRLVDPALQPT